MGYRCIQRVLRHSRQRGSAKLLLVAIADLADDEGRNASPSIAALARIVGSGERHVTDLLQQLKQAGELTWERGGGPTNCNRYTILVGHEHLRRRDG